MGCKEPMPTLVDRLSEMRGRAVAFGVPVGSLEATVGSAAGGGGGGRRNSEDASRKLQADFFAVISELQNKLGLGKKGVDKVDSLRTRLALATTQKQETQVRKELDEAIAETNRQMTDIKSEIEQVQGAIDRLESVEGAGGKSETKMKKNMLSTVTRRFRELLVAFQKTQSSLQEEAKEKTVRQLQVAVPSMKQAEAEELVEKNGASAAEAIKSRVSVQAQVVQDETQAHQQVVTALYGLQAKMNDIRKLEQSIANLHQMFVEMGALIDRQGEILDHIEVSVTNTKTYTREAEKALVLARKKQYKAEKKTMCLCCCCAVLLAVILFPMWISGSLR